MSTLTASSHYSSSTPALPYPIPAPTRAPFQVPPHLDPHRHFENLTIDPTPTGSEHKRSSGRSCFQNLINPRKMAFWIACTVALAVVLGVLGATVWKPDGNKTNPGSKDLDPGTPTINTVTKTTSSTSYNPYLRTPTTVARDPRGPAPTTSLSENEKCRSFCDNFRDQCRNNCLYSEPSYGSCVANCAEGGCKTNCRINSTCCHICGKDWGSCVGWCPQPTNT